VTLLEQVLFALYDDFPGRMLELGAKNHPEKGPYKALFEFEGWEHVSVDLNGLYGSLKLDLTQPLDLGRFDVVTNFGTTEHVPDQLAVWHNIHNALKPGGWLISTTPSPGQWPGHGRWYPTEEWYQAFCNANDYEVKLIRTFDQGIPARDMVGCVAVRRGGDFFTMPETPMYESPGGKVGEYSS